MGDLKSGEVRPRNAPLFVALLILVAVASFVAWQQHRTSQELASRIDAIAGMESRVVARLAGQAAAFGEMKSSVERALAGMDTRLAGQDATFGEMKSSVERALAGMDTRLAGQAAALGEMKSSVERALGHVVLTEPPEDLRAGVRAALERWLPASQPAELPVDGSVLRDEIAALEMSMQTGLRSAFESDLRRLHWWADALDAVQSTREDAGRAESDYPQLRALRIGSPVRAPQWCFETVRAAERRKLLALAQSRAAQEQVTIAEIDAVQDLLDVVQREMGSEVPTVIAEASSRLIARRRSIAARELGHAIDELVAERGTALAKITDPVLLLQVQASYHGQLLGLLSSIAGSDGVDTGRIQSLAGEWSRAMHASETKMRNERLLRYQKWALEKIELTERTGNAASTTLDDDEVEIFKAIRDQLIPIDSSLLEPPLRMKFDQTWTKWTDQLKDVQKPTLLREVASTPKKGLGDV